MTTSVPASGCVVCGSALAPGAPFCGVCGTPVAGTPVTRVPITGVPVLAAAVLTAPVAGAPAARAPKAGAPYSRVPGASEPVPVMPRVLALFIDQSVAVVVGLLAFGVVVLFVGFDSIVAQVVAVAFGMLAWVAQCAWEGSTGRTVGNNVLRLRTVSAVTGRPAGAARVLVRLLVEGAGAIGLGIGTYIVAASGGWDGSGAQRGWHDKAAGTMVVWAPAAPAPGATRGLATSSAPPPVTSSSAIISAVPGWPSSATPPVPPTQHAQPIHDPQPVQPVAPTQPPEPAAPAALEDDLDETRLAGALRSRPRARSLAPRLVFDTGQVVAVTGFGVAGRNPSATAAENVVHVVAVADPARSVSKTHMAFGLDVGGLWFTDRGSTNGTVVVAPDGSRKQLGVGDRAHVAPGTVVEFGERRVRVEAP